MRDYSIATIIVRKICSYIFQPMGLLSQRFDRTGNYRSKGLSPFLNFPLYRSSLSFYHIKPAIMEHTRGQCLKRNQDGLPCCGCIEFTPAIEQRRHDWCLSCEHHINMHERCLTPMPVIFFMLRILNVES